MELFLLRHGDAEVAAPRDRDRPLSSLGQQEVASMINAVKPELVNIDHVFASPYLRAQQTLDIVKECLQLPCSSIQQSDALTPCADPRRLTDLLEPAPNELLNSASSNQKSRCKKSVLFVTHQPLVGTFLDYICGLEPGRYRMGTSALAAIDFDVVGAALGTLRWLKHPN